MPQFEVRIAGAGLPRDVLRDVTQLTYRDNIKEIDSFELTVNNWDVETSDYKYIGSETEETLSGSTPESERYKLFEPSNRNVEIRMGYTNILRVMMKGNITTMEPSFPSGGAPTLTVRGLNTLHQLRCRQYSTTWGTEVDRQYSRDSEIAKRIGELREGGKKRFPFPVEIDTSAIQDEPVIQYLAQENQYDIDFLLSRARMRGYVVFIQESDQEVQGSRDRLYFGPPLGSVQGLRNVTFELEWGKSLVDIKPTLTTANQVKSVKFRGWDRASRRAINITVSVDDLRINFNRDLLALLTRSGECGQREDVVVNEPVFTEQQARRRAEAILLNRLREMVKISGTTVGLPDLRAGQLVIIKGIGSRLSGTYLLTDTTHTIGDSGYTTRFNARLESSSTTGGN